MEDYAQSSEARFSEYVVPYQRLWAVTTVGDRSRIIVSVC